MDLGCIKASEQNDPHYSSKSEDYMSETVSYQRGHLQPANPFRFDKLAVLGTFHPTNVIPQIGKVNGGVWSNNVEAMIHAQTKVFPGYVMTGACASTEDVTKGRLQVPTCIWTLHCFKDRDGRTFVNGYWADNKPIAEIGRAHV